MLDRMPSTVTIYFHCMENIAMKVNADLHLLFYKQV